MAEEQHKFYIGYQLFSERLLSVTYVPTLANSVSLEAITIMYKRLLDVSETADLLVASDLETICAELASLDTQRNGLRLQTSRLNT